MPCVTSRVTLFSRVNSRIRYCRWRRRRTSSILRWHRGRVFKVWPRIARYKIVAKWLAFRFGKHGKSEFPWFHYLRWVYAKKLYVIWRSKRIRFITRYCMSRFMYNLITYNLIYRMFQAHRNSSYPQDYKRKFRSTLFSFMICNTYYNIKYINLYI